MQQKLRILTQSDEIRIHLYFDDIEAIFSLLTIYLITNFEMIKCCEVLGFHDIYSDKGNKSADIRYVFNMLTTL